MTPKTNREVVEQYVKAVVARDLDLQAEVCNRDMVVDYPQSGERIRGWDNFRAAHESYPGGLTQGAAAKVVGSEDKWVLAQVSTSCESKGRVTSTPSSVPPDTPTA